MPYLHRRGRHLSIVKEKVAPGKTTCSLCSRLRRGILYRTAKEIGATQDRAGPPSRRHPAYLHAQACSSTAAPSRPWPPKLRAGRCENVVIRPLAYCKEGRHQEVCGGAMRFPIIPCTLCGTQPNLQRQAMREMANEWEARNPLWIKSMFTAMSNVVPSHMLDRELFDFNAFKLAEGGEFAGGYAVRPGRAAGAGRERGQADRTLQIRRV
jgi:tRNA 2-thiocytidine biosynthesis protein TtcA